MVLGQAWPTEGEEEDTSAVALELAERRVVALGPCLNLLELAGRRVMALGLEVNLLELAGRRVVELRVLGSHSERVLTGLW
jgi:hypothetical protein